MTERKRAVILYLSFGSQGEPTDLQRRHEVGARRPDLVGLTVSQAVDVIDAELARYKHTSLRVKGPITVNGQYVKLNSRRKLKDGDALSLDP